MSGFHSVVTEQKVFICAVCSFIGKLLRAVLPDVAWDSRYLPSEDELSASLDDVIRGFVGYDSDACDCRLAMAQFACKKMKRVCDMLKNISASVGLQDVAAQYLDGLWFIDMLLRKDTSKLNKLYYTIDFTDDKPSRILMNVAAILEGRTDGYDAMSAQAKRKADSETKELIVKVGESVESLHAKIDAVQKDVHETKETLLAKAEEIIRKCGKVNFGGKRKCRHTPEQKKVCMACWMMALENEELKSNTKNGKATFEAAFRWYKSKLKLVGVVTARKFISVMRTISNSSSAENIKQLEAKREAERKAEGRSPRARRRQPPPK